MTIDQAAMDYAQFPFLSATERKKHEEVIEELVASPWMQKLINYMICNHMLDTIRQPAGDVEESLRGLIYGSILLGYFIARKTEPQEALETEWRH